MKKFFLLYQNINLLSQLTKYFGDKNCKKREPYSHTTQGFLQFLAQKMKLTGIAKIQSRDSCFGISLFLVFFLHSSQLFADQNFTSTLQEAQLYFLIDADTKEILLSKNADVRIAPSSMTKLMTAYVVFDQIKKGRVNFENQCLIGLDAWRKSGSTMFLNYGDIVSIEDLVKGLLVVSGNDAAIALAETTAGGINNFAILMNLKAKELGLKNSHFRNPHGLNQEGHYMSLRDIATLAIRLYEDFPEYVHYLGISEFTYHNITQRNRNPLIMENYEGAVGGKTGHTNEGGYGMVGIVKRENRRLVAVVNNTRTARKRAQLVFDMLNYGFEDYKKLTFFEKNQIVTNAEVWLGKKSQVELMTNQEIAINVPRFIPLESVDVVVKYRKPVYAPVAEGLKIATLVVEVKGYKTFEFSLFAKQKVDKVGYFRRVHQILRYKIGNFLRRVSR
jgi:D-alanyl-D-alanine carboxypeptidase (penicillin-binding protein 5/6)